MADAKRSKAQARITRWKKRLIKNQDIAERLQIHESEVSRMFTGKGKVSPKTVDKVLEAEDIKL